MIKITEKKVGDKTYRNINLKDMEDKSSIIVTKRFAEGRKLVSPTLKNYKGDPVVSYSCVANYEGQDVAFFLSEKVHPDYAKVGGEGDKVKITMTEVKKENPKTKVKMLLPTYTFEKVD
jgi:hypothetical protein